LTCERFVRNEKRPQVQGKRVLTGPSKRRERTWGEKIEKEKAQLWLGTGDADVSGCRIATACLRRGFAAHFAGGFDMFHCILSPTPLPVLSPLESLPRTRTDAAALWTPAHLHQQYISRTVYYLQRHSSSRIASRARTSVYYRPVVLLLLLTAATWLYFLRSYSYRLFTPHRLPHPSPLTPRIVLWLHRD
jgi:hypothetical protein